MHRSDYTGFQSLLRQDSSSIKDLWPRSKDALQSFNPFFVRTHLRSRHWNEDEKSWVYVSIPSSSGLIFDRHQPAFIERTLFWFQSLLRQDSSSINEKSNLCSISYSWFQSLLRQDSSSIAELRPRLRGQGKSFNPFFVRTHLRSLTANLFVESDERFNPFFVRTHLRSRNYSVSTLRRVLVSIPSSSGLIFDPCDRLGVGVGMLVVSIPSSSGLIFDLSLRCQNLPMYMSFQSLLRQDSSSITAHSSSSDKRKTSFNPFFVRTHLRSLYR